MKTQIKVHTGGEVFTCTTDKALGMVISEWRNTGMLVIQHVAINPPGYNPKLEATWRIDHDRTIIINKNAVSVIEFTEID